MTILNFSLALFYLWIFINITFRDLVLSVAEQSLLALLLFLAFLVFGIKEIENKNQ